MKSTIINITSNNRQTFENINGSIKKIFILAGTPKHYVNLRFTTNEGEVIYETNITQPITILYPHKYMDNQGRGLDYYSNGNLFVDVNGLNIDDEIEQISIFYE